MINLKGELVGLTTMAASPAGFDAMAGYAIPMDKLGRRAVETLKEGKEIEYGLLGIQADRNFTNRVGEVQPNSPAALGNFRSTTRSSPSTTRRSSTSIRLILAVNVYSAGDTRPTQDPPRRRDDRAHHRPGQVPRRRRGHRHQPAQAVARPARRLHQRAQPTRPSAPISSTPRCAGVVVAEVEEGSPAAVAGHQERPVDPARSATRRRRDSPPRLRRGRRPTLEGPVTLETDLGPVTVK